MFLSGACNVRTQPAREFAIEPLDEARAIAAGIRKSVIVFPATGALPFLSGSDGGRWEPPSPAVWNCHIHD
jgi:hypothetical protein